MSKTEKVGLVVSVCKSKNDRIYLSLSYDLGYRKVVLSYDDNLIAEILGVPRFEVESYKDPGRVGEVFVV